MAKRKIETIWFTDEGRGPISIGVESFARELTPGVAQVHVRLHSLGGIVLSADEAWDLAALVQGAVMDADRIRAEAPGLNRLERERILNDSQRRHIPEQFRRYSGVPSAVDSNDKRTS